MAMIMHLKLNFSLKTIFIVHVVVACILGFVIYPKSIPIAEYSGFNITGYYRGLGLSSWGDTLLGKRFYKLVVKDTIDGGRGEVSFQGEGYNSYRSYYPNGSLREKGEIFVRIMAFYDPIPDRHDVRWGEYYRPDGTLGSTIKDGTGVQILWYSSGQITWRLELKNYHRVKHESWNENGQLISYKEYP